MELLFGTKFRATACIVATQWGPPCAFHFASLHECLFFICNESEAFLQSMVYHCLKIASSLLRYYEKQYFETRNSMATFTAQLMLHVQTKQEQQQREKKTPTKSMKTIFILPLHFFPALISIGYEHLKVLCENRITSQKKTYTKKMFWFCYVFVRIYFALNVSLFWMRISHYTRLVWMKQIISVSQYVQVYTIVAVRCRAWN